MGYELEDKDVAGKAAACRSGCKGEYADISMDFLVDGIADAGLKGEIEAVPQHVPQHVAPDQSPEKRLALLFERMPGQRKLLREIIGYCKEPRTPSEVDAFTQGLQGSGYAVYSPVILRQLLEEAGALAYVEPQQGAGAGEVDAGAKPEALAQLSTGASAEVVLSAGEAFEESGYLVVADRPEGWWQATEEGIALLDSQDPLGTLRGLLDEDERYRPIYLSILCYCAESARTKKEIEVLVDNDPVLQQPRRYSNWFLDRLEACDALEWRNAWHTTDIGCAILEASGVQSPDKLEGVPDEGSAA
ncbi:MAG: hypothetical protein LBG81_06225 [Coriobacteriaceae bacterium]|nr:hypothetical protein [Coriobacteriaceae bacterium]